MKYTDISGKRFGALTVLRLDFISKHGHAHWLCLCDCGKEHSTSGISIRASKALSCGCRIHVLKPIAERMQDKIREVNGCWEWIGARDLYGYGVVWVDGQNRGAHRVMWEIKRGPIQGNLQLDHLCRNRRCCNPDHLEPVSPQENSLRGFSPAGINARKSHCPRGHPYDAVYSGRRTCKVCNASRQVEFRKRKLA